MEQATKRGMRSQYMYINLQHSVFLIKFNTQCLNPTCCLRKEKIVGTLKQLGINQNTLQYHYKFESP